MPKNMASMFFCGMLVSFADIQIPSERSVTHVIMHPMNSYIFLGGPKCIIFAWEKNHRETAGMNKNHRECFLMPPKKP